MCTVTYLPGNGKIFTLTSNRDERFERSIADPPDFYFRNGRSLLYPRDKDALGTWIATDGSRFTLCLLNGAFHPHKHEPPYRRSRGLVLLDFFDTGKPEEYFANYDFKGIEPFTLLLIDIGKERKVHEARWDGTTLFHSMPDPRAPHIWSSVTLYSPETIGMRENWFSAFIHGSDNYKGYSAFDFHRMAGSGDAANGLLMNRNHKVFTVSVTSIQREEHDVTMLYYDTLSQKLFENIFAIHNAEFAGQSR
ncbi:MAG: NRDE family protein [Bacteroidia bacterium]|nr:NRDE family protein [Bacteroidia bacterium]